MAVVRERADVGNISGDHTQMMPKAPDAKILPAKSLEECRRESVVVRAQRATRRGVNIRTGCDGQEREGGRGREGGREEERERDREEGRDLHTSFVLLLLGASGRLLLLRADRGCKPE